MATSRQPLLENPQEIKTSKFVKVLGKVLFVIVFLSTIVLLASHFRLNFRESSSRAVSVVDICGNADNLESCVAMISEVAPNGVLGLHDVDPLKSFLEHSITDIRKAITMAADVSRHISDHKNHAAVDICVRLLDMSMDRLESSLAALSANKLRSSYSDVRTWLSGVLTNHDTCLDTLHGKARQLGLQSTLTDLMARASASLAMLVALSPMDAKQGDSLTKPIIASGFPTWVTSKDRKLLELMPKEIQPNVVVAQDGSGNYQTVVEGVASAPNESETRYVVYVKKGTYVENVKIEKWQKNIMLVGDGMNSTIITGSWNDKDGVHTFDSGTLIVEGDRFIGQDMWIQNTAGPEKNQAVALRVSSDKTVINRCQIDAYQDTLYHHTYKQFYRDCKIIGTVDFMFGNGAVVLQNCTIIARKPSPGQSNMLTAQGKTNINQDTGTSIQMCRLIPSEDLKAEHGSVRSYFGRPWKNLSTTVIMQSYIDDHIHPSGWSPWDESTNFELMYYGEYENNGPGACTDGRVDWPGFHVITDPAVAMQFTVAELIKGGSWLESTGVDYIEGL